MPKERDVQTPGGTVFTLSGEEREENTIVVKRAETFEQKKARFARIRDRGYVNDYFHVDLPPDKWGEWVPNDFREIDRMKRLGFTDGSEYVANRTMHHDGTRPANADVVFMVQDMEDHEMWLKVTQEKFDEMNRKKNGKQKEEEQYEKLVKQLRNEISGGEATPSFSQSKDSAATVKVDAKTVVTERTTLSEKDSERG